MEIANKKDGTLTVETNGNFEGLTIKVKADTTEAKMLLASIVCAEHGIKAGQQRKIYAFMTEHGSITPMDAFSKLGITKLSTRIGEMMRKGIDIEKTMCHGTNAYGEPVRYMSYSLRG